MKRVGIKTFSLIYLWLFPSTTPEVDGQREKDENVMERWKKLDNSQTKVKKQIQKRHKQKETWTHLKWKWTSGLRKLSSVLLLLAITQKKETTTNLVLFRNTCFQESAIMIICLIHTRIPKKPYKTLWGISFFNIWKPFLSLSLPKRRIKNNSLQLSEIQINYHLQLPTVGWNRKRNEF